jgi:hypothetical protein
LQKRKSIPFLERGFPKGLKMSISHAYPTELPLDELRTLYAKVKGRAVEIPQLLHAAWVVAGYGLGRFGGELPVGEAEPGQSPVDELNALEQLVSPVPPVGSGLAASLIWPVVLKLALKILAEIAG